MQDPIGGFQRIRELYITYLETAFRIRDPHVSRERRHLLETPGTLCTEPFIEPIPQYETCDFRLHELAHDGTEDARLPGFTSEERAAFAELALAGLFDAEPAPPGATIRRVGEYPLYRHQAEMLWRGIRPGKPSIVTSGTGSGKTEAFLLPIFAMLAKEAVHWPAPAEGFLRRRWWQDETGKPYGSWQDVPNRPSKVHPARTPFVPHRRHERRPPAVRALIIYPMNALVEDQLVRIRRALDSDEARETMARRFNGNHIFLGRYTSATPITDFHIHPRPGEKEYARRQRKLQELFAAMRQLQQTQEVARQEASSTKRDDPRFLFPSIDGAELPSRWDMQAHPPDILITNVSMLSAMLAREVDAPIFDLTRDWLSSDENAYFFLVLDELHLQRGSAGTEVSFLLRLLFHRLGLTDPDQRHKLRILASSASLPTDGKERDASLDYLWDAFGRHGLWTGPGTTENTTDREAWQAAIVEGEIRKEDARGTHRLRMAPYNALIGASPTTADKEPASVSDPRDEEVMWRTIASDLLGHSDHSDLASLVRECVEETGQRLAVACWSEKDGRPRATPLGILAQRLFGKRDTEAMEAVRGLLVVRGVGDSFHTWFGGLPLQAPSFRIHTFFRSIEGLFGPADGRAGVAEVFRNSSRPVGRLDIERDVRYEAPTYGGKPKRRLELLYCECCGELFFGGMRSRGTTRDYLELLPNDPNLDGLPDTASSQLFEDLSAADFAIFWPQCNKKPEDPLGVGTWLEATLEPEIGQVRRLGPAAKKSTGEGIIHGYLYHRPFDAEDRHKRKGTQPGTAVPYQCPACGSEYSQRGKEYRLSPIRNFRTGFAKTTQLLATELFDLLKLDADEPKLVSFSDSRQDAANAALDIERRHHEDVRRQILVETIRERLRQRLPREMLEHDLTEVRVQYVQAVEEGDEEKEKEFRKRYDELRARLNTIEDPSVPLTDVLESLKGDATDFRGLRMKRSSLRPLLRRFVELGIHPTDPTGNERFMVHTGGDKQKSRKIGWDRLFRIDGEEIDWRDEPVIQSQLDDARRVVVGEAQRLVSEIIFNKTYFSLEETGLGYAVLPLERYPIDEYGRLNAFLRVFADAYRFQESPWGEQPPGWRSAEDIGTNNRVRRFAQAIWKDQQALSQGLTEEERKGRLDIGYRKTAGQHVIIEMKRPERVITTPELITQIDKYLTGMQRILVAQGTPNESIEIVVLLGVPPRDWSTDAGRDRSRKALGEYGARVVFYEELLRSARQAYQDYLEKRVLVDKLDEVIKAIDDYAPPSSS